MGIPCQDVGALGDTVTREGFEGLTPVGSRSARGMGQNHAAGRDAAFCLPRLEGFAASVFMTSRRG